MDRIPTVNLRHRFKKKIKIITLKLVKGVDVRIIVLINVNLISKHLMDLYMNMVKMQVHGNKSEAHLNNNTRNSQVVPSQKSY